MNAPTDIRHQAMIARRYLEHLELCLRKQAIAHQRQGEGEDAYNAAMWAERAHELKHYISRRI